MRHAYGSGFSVQADGDCSSVSIDASDSGEIAVEDTEPGPVLEAHDSVTGPEVATVGVQCGSAKPPGLGHEGTSLLVEFVDGGVAMTDEQHLGRVTDLFDVAVPGIDRLVDGVVVGGGEVDFAASVVHCHRPGHRALAQLCECGSFPVLVLADVLSQLDGREAGYKGGEEATGVDLGELMVVADQDELAGCGVDQV